MASQDLSCFSVFSIIDCNIPLFSDFAMRLKDAYDSVQDDLTTLMNDAFAAELFGYADKSECAFNKINNIHYLMVLMAIIYYQKKMDIANNGTDEGTIYYVEEYDIECIKKNFLCINVDISQILSIFNLNKNIPDCWLNRPIDRCSDMSIFCN